MEYEHLQKVKSMLGISGNFQDEALEGYAQEVIEFMVGAGVKREMAESESSKGLVARGIADLWNLGSGNASLSPYFKQRVIQLVFKNKKTTIDPPETGTTEVIEITNEEIEEILKG